jgi:hypothetical protein
MTDNLAIAIIVSTPPTIVAIVGLVIGLKNKDAVKEVHLSLNSRLDQLLELTKKAGIAEGRKSEADGRKSETDQSQTSTMAESSPFSRD